MAESAVCQSSKSTTARRPDAVAARTAWVRRAPRPDHRGRPPGARAQDEAGAPPGRAEQGEPGRPPERGRKAADARGWRPDPDHRHGARRDRDRAEREGPVDPE